MPNDTSAEKFLLWTRQIASDTDSLGVELRTSVGVPTTRRADVHLVTDEALCQRASIAADSAGEVPSPSGGCVHVARIGTGYYAAHRVGWHAGEWGMVFFFDSTFAPKKAVVTY